MGNNVSAAAQSMATSMAPGIQDKENVKPSNHPHIQFSGENPPPECPMHQKVPTPPKAAASECPVKHDNSDVSPLNMVSELQFKQAMNKKLLILYKYILDATCKSKTSSRSAFSFTN